MIEPIEPVELYYNILQRYNYIINKKLIVAIKEVTKNNPDIYNYKYEFKDAFKKYIYTCGKSVINEVTLSDLNNIRKDGKISSNKVEHIIEIINKANYGISTTLLKEYYKLRYIHTRYFLPLLEIQKILVISKQILVKLIMNLFQMIFSLFVIIQI